MILRRRNPTPLDSEEPSSSLRIHIPIVSSLSKNDAGAISKSNPGRTRAAVFLASLTRSNYSGLAKGRRFLSRFLMTPCGLLTSLLFAYGFCLSQYPFLLYCSWWNQYDEPPPPTEPLSLEELYDKAQTTLRGNITYTLLHSMPVDSTESVYDLFDCPLSPPPGYPQEFPLLDILEHWPTKDTEPRNDRTIHQGVCVINFQTDAHAKEKIRNYQKTEVPFVVRNDPHLLQTAERWHRPHYLDWRLQNGVYVGDYSRTDSMMYWKWNIFTDRWFFRPPTEKRPTTFRDWHAWAVDKDKRVAQSRKNENGTSYQENIYMRLDGCYQKHRAGCYQRPFGELSGKHLLTRVSKADFLFDELDVFNPDHPASKLYNVVAEKQHGIQCHLGAARLTAQAHFDGQNNWLAVLKGSKRYILSHPHSCPHLSLYPMHHPLERHTRVDWTAPNLTEFPDFNLATANEIVLQAGDMLYLPTMWFHHIVSLQYNIQCHMWIGYNLIHDATIDECGFLYPLPDAK